MSDKATITLEAGEDPLHAHVRVKIAVHDTALVGHQAVFRLLAEARVKDKNPVHAKTVLHTETFTVQGNHEIRIPRGTLHAYTYQGVQLDLLLHTRLEVDDAVLFDTVISTQQALDLGMKAPVSGDAESIVEPADSFMFFRNLDAIPARNRVITLALAVVGGIVMLVSALIGAHDQFVPESVTWLFSHYDSDGDSNSPLAKGLAGSGAVGAAIWFLIRAQLRKYMGFHLGRIPQRIRPRDVVPAASLFSGRSRVPLRQVTLRVVASNMECGQYVRGSGTKRRTVSFREPVRGVVLYERQVTQIPAGVPIAAYFQGSVDFDRLFTTLYPPLKVSKSHGLAVHWEIQLLHPEFVDQELVGPNTPLHYEDFLGQ